MYEQPFYKSRTIRLLSAYRVNVKLQENEPTTGSVGHLAVF